jgi:hypothetical protein
MYPYGPGTGGFYGFGWSWWAIAFLIAFVVFFLLAVWWTPYYR